MEPIIAPARIVDKTLLFFILKNPPFKLAFRSEFFQLPYEHTIALLKKYFNTFFKRNFFSFCVYYIILMILLTRKMIIVHNEKRRIVKKNEIIFAFLKKNKIQLCN